ncbi:MAG TPA: hypothetical protein VL974_12285 [Magnetospirillum sp.]|jgi:hypothetical protein|nr:hypothetical protein [Magnetospirillum sp.]
MPRGPRLGHGDRRPERLTGAFLLGVALFMPPLLTIAARDVSVGGVPLLFVWVFGGWLALIAVLAAIVERSGGKT